MTTSGDQEPSTTEDAAAPSIDELQANIERSRDELAKTVDALGAKLDVKTRTKDRFAATRRQAGERLGDARTRAAGYTATARNAATDDQGRPTTAVVAGTGFVVAAGVVVAVVVYRRRR